MEGEPESAPVRRHAPRGTTQFTGHRRSLFPTACKRRCPRSSVSLLYWKSYAPGEPRWPNPDRGAAHIRSEVLQFIAERALAISGASGIAIALAEAGEIVCRGTGRGNCSTARLKAELAIWPDRNLLHNRNHRPLR